MEAIRKRLEDLPPSTEDQFEIMRFERNPISATLLRALNDHVRHSIIREKLILVGGMGLDYNLRLKGDKLYADTEVPDYDYYSPTHAEHAYQLGQELCRAGFPNVDVITAIHTTSMRVRVDGHVVADITYMPADLFASIRTNEYQSVRIIHPYYTMLDQFRSLSMPYENPPNEVITARWRKDVERFNMLYRHYPFTAEKTPPLPAKLHRVVLPAADANDAIGGWAALAWYESQVKVTGLTWTAEHVEIPVARVVVMTSDEVRWRGRQGGAQASSKPIDAKNVTEHEVQRPASSKSAATAWYNGTFSYPPRYETDCAEVYCTWGERVTIIDTGGRRVVSVPALMYYFLNRWLLGGDEMALTGVQRCAEVITKLPPEQVYPVEPLGTMSWAAGALYGVAATTNFPRVRAWKPPTQTFEAEKCAHNRTFDPRASPLFAIDGANRTGPPEELVPAEALLLRV